MKKELKANDLEKQVLDAYFSIRQPTGSLGDLLTEEIKTTIDIQDDLRNTLAIADDVITDYMLKNGYLLKPDIDGALVWNIYKMR